jgi:hypothetical protein
LLQVGISFSSAFNIVEHDITKPYYITLIDANPFLVSEGTSEASAAKKRKLGQRILY